MWLITTPILFTQDALSQMFGLVSPGPLMELWSAGSQRGDGGLSHIWWLVLFPGCFSSRPFQVAAAGSQCERSICLMKANYKASPYSSTEKQTPLLMEGATNT